MSSATHGTDGARTGNVPDRIRRKRDRLVEEAVEKAARRMDANAEEREILREAAERTAERVTRPAVEASDTDSVELLFLD